MIGIGPLITIPLVLPHSAARSRSSGWIVGRRRRALRRPRLGRARRRSFPAPAERTSTCARRSARQRSDARWRFSSSGSSLLYAPCLLASGYIGFAHYAALLYPAARDERRSSHDASRLGVGVADDRRCSIGATAPSRASASSSAVVAVVTLALVAWRALSHADFEHAFMLGAPVRLGAGLLAGLGSALFITLYDYFGYGEAALLGDEVVRPQRTIPLAILISVLLVAALYVAAAARRAGRRFRGRSLLDARRSAAPRSRSTSGRIVVAAHLGPVAAIVVTLLILVTAFASLYGNLLGFSRIPFAAARDGTFLPAFARLHPRKEIPHVALLAVGGLSLLPASFTLDQVIAF